MNDSKFSDNSNEQLEKEIQELKRQKEIRNLQKQKKELEKTMFSGLGGSTADKKENEKLSKKKKFFFKIKITILITIVLLVIITTVLGIFYFRKENVGKKDNLKKKAPAISRNQNMISVTTPQAKIKSNGGKEIAESILKEVIDSLQKGNYSSMIKDKEGLEAMNIFSNAYKKINYKVNNATETQDKVVLNVTMKYPDLSEIPTLITKKVANNVQQLQGKSDIAIEKQTMKWMKELIDQKLNDPSLKYLEETFDMVYVNLNGKWTMPDEENQKFNKILTFNMNM